MVRDLSREEEAICHCEDTAAWCHLQLRQQFSSDPHVLELNVVLEGSMKNAFLLCLSFPALGVLLEHPNRPTWR